MIGVWNRESKDCIEREKEIATEQYKLYVEMADKISDRRVHANKFYVALNSSLIAFYGFATAKNSIVQNDSWLYLVLIAGILICFLWIETVKSYKNINTVKFKVIHEIEEHLPLALYKYEWELAKQGDGSKYRPTSHIEMIVPWVFGFLYVIIVSCKCYSYFFELYH
ncbi:hypothetical protein AY555_10085 (plasmid) [Haematospirillum jordaniae]|uniref:Small integral membrane protein n=2 Tax=Haematospirillum jordaniae TaxID=1549855 RepID=A0A143DG70_9PROT|nr:hypothetical protein AY555_10085 [Haematospirillum jordaniae]